MAHQGIQRTRTPPLLLSSITPALLCLLVTLPLVWNALQAPLTTIKYSITCAALSSCPVALGPVPVALLEAALKDVWGMTMTFQSLDSIWQTSRWGSQTLAEWTGG